MRHKNTKWKYKVETQKYTNNINLAIEKNNFNLN